VTAQADATDFARRSAALWRQVLGYELLGVYAIGSLAHGGFSARYSDVDVAVITENGITQPVLDRVKGEAASLSADWGPKLSLFWSDRNFTVGRFPPLDRIDYLDHAVALTERERVRPARPSLDEVRRYLGSAPFDAWAEQAGRFAAAEALGPKDRKAYLRTQLYPARFCFSWITGRMGSNDQAVAFLTAAPPARLDTGLLARVLQCRQADADPDALFAERALLPAQVEACVALMQGTHQSSQGGCS